MISFFQKAVIRHALTKIPPNEFSLSDGKADYKAVSVYFSPNLKPQYRILEIGDNYMTARCVDDQNWRHDCCIHFSATKGLKIKVRHWYHSIDTTYNGVLDYIWGTITFHSRRTELWSVLRQRIYNRSLKIRDDSTEVLQLIVDEHLRRKSREGAPIMEDIRFRRFEMAELVYGIDIWGHPKRNGISARLDLIIDSLIASKDLRTENHFVSVSGQAVATISMRAADDRKHRDQVRYNRAIIGLTFALVVVGTMQLVATFLSAYFNHRLRFSICLPEFKPNPALASVLARSGLKTLHWSVFAGKPAALHPSAAPSLGTARQPQF